MLPKPTEERRMMLLGGGGHAAVVADALELQRWRVHGFLDDSPSASIANYAHLGSIDEAIPLLKADPQIAFHAAVGANDLRKAWVNMLAFAAHPPVVHPSAIISFSARIDDSAFVGPGVIINARARIGRGSIINSGAVIEHDAEVGEFAHIAPRCVLGGRARVGAQALVGIGSTVMPHAVIGAFARVGAGAVVLDQVADNATVVGNPARTR